jgi:flavin-dependent dehydrogenase
MKHYEVIIIGAGLAGCVLGYLLRKQGKSVLLVEKNDSMQKSKLCGGVVTKKAYQLLSEFYPHHQLDFTTYSSCFIHNADKTLEVPATLYTIPRKDLDDFVLREYLKFGGEIIDKTCYSMLDIYINTIIIDNVIYTFDYLVGADGVLSQVRKDVTGKMQSINFALEDTLSRKAGQAKLEISFFDSFTGYAWTIPNNRCTMVGIGEVSGKMDLKADYHRYLNEIQMYADDKK